MNTQPKHHTKLTPLTPLTQPQLQHIQGGGTAVGNPGDPEDANAATLQRPNPTRFFTIEISGGRITTH